MSIDMSEFYQVFFEEATELLDQMEQLLLDLDIENPDAEQLNAIFRCAHSIKGGSATFGFNDMTEVTHALESLLDQIRKGDKHLKREMVDVSLTAGDVIKAQLAGHRGDGKADPVAAESVCVKLKAFVVAGDDATVVAPVPAAVPAPESATIPVAAPVATGASAPGAPAPACAGNYEIEFAVDGAPQDTRALLDRIFCELDRMGTLAFVRGSREAGVTDSASSQPAQHFALRIASAAPEADIWELLAFNIDPTRVQITAVDPASPVAAIAATQPPTAGVVATVSPAATAVAAAPAAAEDPGYGFFSDLYNAVTPPASAPSGAAPAAPAQASAVPPPQPDKVTGGPRSPGRRATDDPGVSVVRAGRRDSDKVAVSAGSDASSIRVNIEKVDRLINLVGELVIAQAMLSQTVSKVDPVTGEALAQSMNQLDRNMRDLQEAVMSIRMMPIGFVFSRFPRLVRDMAAKLNKQVELKTLGESTELDKGLIEKIADPLTHLVRNSLDHGIEAPEKRVAMGKPAKGIITLSAFHQGGNIVIEVSDDGAGLSRERILAKAKSRGMPVSDDMSDAEVWQLIFEAGLSTAEVVTDVSGRGVGMDVVKRNIQALGGSVEIESAPGVGSRMSIRLPLTLAILDGMSVAVGNETFIVPLTAIVESLQAARNDIKSVHGRGVVVHVRGEYLPVIALHQLFGIQPRVTQMERGIMMILEADGVKKAMFIDELLGQHQVVIKSLEGNYRKLPGVSGATIMGDGRVALILDVGAIIRMNGARTLRAA